MPTAAECYIEKERKKMREKERSSLQSDSLAMGEERVEELSARSPPPPSPFLLPFLSPPKAKV